jgi:integrase
MACIKKRRGRWVVDYRDAAGVRRWVTCRTRDEAKHVLRDKLLESTQPTRPAVNPRITFSDYSKRWLKLAGATIKPRTLESYASTLRRYLLPAFEKTQVRQLARGLVKAFLVAKLADGYARNTVRIMHATLRVMLNAAIEDGLILANPADRLGRTLRLAPSKATRQEQIKAFDREQLEHFLRVTTERELYLFPLFLLMARTGVRPGEAFAIMWVDIHFARRELRVERAVFAGKISTPKSGHGRTVDMSQQLTETLRRLQADQKADKLRRGLQDMPLWVFPSLAGTPLDHANVEKAFKRVLKAAELPLHFTPRCLRHTFASLLLQQGVSPAYVQRQLGHASIQLTVDTYGKWLPMGNKAAVDALDSPSGSKVVATAGQESARASQVTDSSRATRRSRTGDLLITKAIPGSRRKP